MNSIATSYGIINVHFPKEIKEFEDIIKNIEETNIITYTLEKEIVDKNLYNEIYNKLNNNLLFLLISRKHSLGYIEFIRGNYDISEPIETIRSAEHLFLQMTDLEIYDIFNNTFDVLWNSLWKRNAKKEIYRKEFLLSQEKFNYVISTYSINSFKPKYPVSEWGFPKGRKNTNETNLSCAIRECYEETSLDKSEMNIIHNIEPIVEIMTGTNNVEYKHIYYISTVKFIRKLYVSNDIFHFAEIETAGWFTKERINNLIRPYHTEKLKIINKIIEFFALHIYKKLKNN